MKNRIFISLLCSSLIFSSAWTVSAGSTGTAASAVTDSETAEDTLTSDGTGSDNGMEAPPEGAPRGFENGGQMPVPPDGAPNGADGQMPAPPDGAPEGQGGPGGASDGQGGPGGAPDGQGGPGGAPGSDAAPSYTAANTLTADSDGESFSSENDSENAVLVDGTSVAITGASVNKTGDSDGDNSDFYGINAAILAINGGTLSISGSEIKTDGAHANGVFSYGEGTTVHISDSEIVTTGNNSGGIMTTGGAVMEAENLTVSTSGNSSAAIRSDRGGGTVTVEGGTYSASGVGSPAIYSTADITVSGAVLDASNSEAVVIEGGNSVELRDVMISGNNATLNGQSTINTNVLIYQSMSGDASEGNSVFTMDGGSMTSGTGSMFHVTNVTTTINLSGVDFTYADGAEFLIASADSWGNSGSNGGHVTLNLDNQEITGDMVVDASSDLTLTLDGGSAYTGAVNADNEGTVNVTINDGTWTLTGDSYVSSFNGDLSSVVTNGFHLYIDGEEAI